MPGSSGRAHRVTITTTTATTGRPSLSCSRPRDAERSTSDAVRAAPESLCMTSGTGSPASMPRHRSPSSPRRPAPLHEAARVLVADGRLVAAIVHPFASAHLGRDPELQRSYFDVQRTVDDVEREGLTFTSFHQIHRPLDAWLALFFDAGFVIEDVREPRPSLEDITADPSLAKSRAKPAFLRIRAAALP